MRKSRKPPIPASSIPPGRFRFGDGTARAVVCPYCHRWQPLDHWVIRPHHKPPEDPSLTRRCPGSSRLIERDRTVQQLRDDGYAAAVLAQHRATHATPPPGERRRRTPPPALRPPDREENT